MACPGTHFPHAFVDLGGVRVITHFTEAQVSSVVLLDHADFKPSDVKAIMHEQ